MEKKLEKDVDDCIKNPKSVVMVQDISIQPKKPLKKAIRMITKQSPKGYTIY